MDKDMIMDTEQNIRAIDPAHVAELSREFGNERGNVVARNAVTSANVLGAACNPTRMRTYADTYGVSVRRTGEVTNQRQSGRCWLFATLNVARARTLALLDVDDFEFSQTYGMFYDKLEKANAFLGNVIRTAGLPVSDRSVSYLFGNPISDGGEFRFAANLIAKWGVIPKSAMPETACTRNSEQMNDQLKRLLRVDAAALRKAVAEGRSEAVIDELRCGMVDEIHRVLCVCLGEPPVTFDFETTIGPAADVDPTKVSDQLPAAPENDDKAGGDDKGEKPRRVLRDLGITPLEFLERYVRFDADDYVELISVPGESRPFEHLLGIPLMDTVEGGERWRFLNMPMEVLEDAAVNSLREGVPCYMACDVNQQFVGRKHEEFPGTLATDTVDVEALFNVRLSMDRATMFDLHESSFTHAMTFQGVEIGQNGRPTAWRVENSWGKENCKDGYLIMSGDWYRLYGGNVVVERRFLPDDVLRLWDTLPIEDVEPWSGLGCAVGLKS